MKCLLSVCHSLQVLGNLLALNNFMTLNKLENFKKAIFSEFKTLSLNLYKKTEWKRGKNSVMIVAMAEFRIFILLYSYRSLQYKLNQPAAFSGESVKQFNHHY